jgi:hypothetical protein
MTWLVVPLSNARPNLPHSFVAALPDVAAMILFGLIVAATPLLETYLRRPR